MINRKHRLRSFASQPEAQYRCVGSVVVFIRRFDSVMVYGRTKNTGFAFDSALQYILVKE